MAVVTQGAPCRPGSVSAPCSGTSTILRRKPKPVVMFGQVGLPPPLQPWIEEPLVTPSPSRCVRAIMLPVAFWFVPQWLQKHQSQ